MNTTDELDRLEEQAVTHAGEMIEAQRQINAERLRAFLYRLANVSSPVWSSRVGGVGS